MGMSGSSLSSDTSAKWGISAKSAASSSGGGGGGGISDYEQQMRQQASEMRSLIEDILQPTEVSAMDMAATKAGTYVDKWDEYGRKMRAIANDQSSVWRDMVPQDILAQGEDAIRDWAEQQQKLFYAGQMTGEINWDDFINRARDEVANKQARESLIQLAGQKLAEAGIGAGVTAADLLGLNSPGANIGADIAKSFGEGAVAGDVAGQVTKAFGESITASAETWMSYGKVAIEHFIIGADSGISPNTGAQFAERIWPYLRDIIGREEPLP